MIPKELPPIKLLRECFRYERSGGVLFWKKRPLCHFKNEAWRRYWNRRWVGKKIGSITSSGHLTVRLFGSAYKVHRIIWKMDKGIEPPLLVEHKNRKPAANSIFNLRPASYAQNAINKNRQAGIKKTRNGAWEARIHKARKYIHLGTFKKRSEAVAVRKKAEISLYGEFAPCA
jgi:hypothetical protein